MEELSLGRNFSRLACHYWSTGVSQNDFNFTHLPGKALKEGKCDNNPKTIIETKKYSLYL